VKFPALDSHSVEKYCTVLALLNGDDGLAGDADFWAAALGSDCPGLEVPLILLEI